MSRPSRRNKWEARVQGVTATGPLSKTVVDKWMTAAITKATPIVHAAITAAAPAKTGRHVRAGIHHEVIPNPKRFEIPVIGRVWLNRAAVPVEVGAAPHDIHARHKAMRFQGRGPSGRFGGIQYTKVVHHPGTQPNDFFGRGVDAAAPDVDAYFDAAAAQIERELAK